MEDGTIDKSAGEPVKLPVDRSETELSDNQSEHNGPAREEFLLRSFTADFGGHFVEKCGEASPDWVGALAIVGGAKVGIERKAPEGGAIGIGNDPVVPAVVIAGGVFSNGSKGA